MNKTGATMKQPKVDASATRVAMNLEVDVIPVSDVERSKRHGGQRSVSSSFDRYQAPSRRSAKWPD
jgi:hypothetical protein